MAAALSAIPGVTLASMEWEAGAASLEADMPIDSSVIEAAIAGLSDGTHHDYRVTELILDGGGVS